jgi:hypothetical protein
MVLQGHPTTNDIQKEILELGAHGILIELSQDLKDKDIRRIGWSLVSSLHAPSFVGR